MRKVKNEASHTIYLKKSINISQNISKISQKEVPIDLKNSENISQKIISQKRNLKKSKIIYLEKKISKTV